MHLSSFARLFSSKNVLRENRNFYYRQFPDSEYASAILFKSLELGDEKNMILLTNLKYFYD